jgi:hypothetical protein
MTAEEFERIRPDWHRWVLRVSQESDPRHAT